MKKIRPLLNKIAGPYQTSFMPGRQAKYNITIAQEVIHTHENKKGKKGGITPKIDLEKPMIRFIEISLKKFS